MEEGYLVPNAGLPVPRAEEVRDLAETLLLSPEPLIRHGRYLAIKFRESLFHLARNIATFTSTDVADHRSEWVPRAILPHNKAVNTLRHIQSRQIRIGFSDPFTLNGEILGLLEAINHIYIN